MVLLAMRDKRLTLSAAFDEKREKRVAIERRALKRERTTRLKVLNEPKELSMMPRSCRRGGVGRNQQPIIRSEGWDDGRGREGAGVRKGVGVRRAPKARPMP